MRITVHFGWDTYTGDLSGAEIEVLARISNKLEKVSERYLSERWEGDYSGYCLVQPEETPIKGPQHPDFQIAVITGSRPIISHEDYTKSHELADEYKAAKEASDGKA